MTSPLAERAREIVGAANVVTDPSARGKGFGQALMHSRLDRCDQENAPAYLEASKRELVMWRAAR